MAQAWTPGRVRQFGDQLDDQVYPFATRSLRLASLRPAGASRQSCLLELTLSAHRTNESSEPDQVRIWLNIQRLLHGDKFVAC